MAGHDAQPTHSLFIRIESSAAIHSHRSGSRKHPQWLSLFRILEWSCLVYCIFWGIPHSGLKGIPCALTCFLLWTEGGQSSSQSQCLWLPCIGTGPGSLRTSILQSRPDTYTMLAYYRPGHLKHRHLFSQRHKSINIQYNTQGIQFDAQT